jgi:hypothetical protein
VERGTSFFKINGNVNIPISYVPIWDGTRSKVFPGRWVKS